MSFKDEIIAEIAANGPIPLSRYMERCNAHYYATRMPFGTGGDFITAPEISQIFGELIGLWAADMWQRAGSPSPFLLVELGPGRGTLMQDALRASEKVPGFHDAVQVHLVETSLLLRAEQKSRVTNAHWHDSINTLPPGLCRIIIANEFFDALGINQYQWQAPGWRQVFIGMDKEGDLTILHDHKDTHLPRVLPIYKEMLMRDSFYEHPTYIESCYRPLVEQLIENSGALLVIDYGSSGMCFGDTLQVVKDHECATIEDLLGSPGENDITAHVNFSILEEQARALGARVSDIISQGQYLRALGLDLRTAQLGRSNPARANEVTVASARLADSDQMGELFKVMCITSKMFPKPAGFP
jgi:NADH dehydrogenase [ubiquinone] 1 alpha subcomplex assembly factor 7